jgi:hypothetical protein
MPSRTPATVPSLPGTSRCLLPPPLNPAASTHARCASVSGTSRRAAAPRTIQIGTDRSLLSAGTKTSAASAGAVFSLVDMG